MNVAGVGKKRGKRAVQFSCEISLIVFRTEPRAWPHSDPLIFIGLGEITSKRQFMRVFIF